MRWIMFLAAAAIFAGGCKKEAAKYEEKTTRVHTSGLKKMVFQQRIPVQGTVVPEEFAVISAKISGTLEKFYVKEGQQVKKGEVLFEVDRKVLDNQVIVKKDEINVRQAELNSAVSGLKTAEISLKQAERDHQRAINLAEKNAISDANKESFATDYEKAHQAVSNAKAAVSNAQSQLKQAISNLAIAEKNRDDSLIRAPFDCMITETFVEENEFVAAGTPILKLENQQKLEVECFISATYYGQIEQGVTPVEFPAKSGVLRSKITYKAPSIDPESRTFKIKAEVPESAGAVSGMLSELNIILAEREGYGLPESAVLLRAGDRMIAYTVKPDKRAESVEIIRGIVDSKEEFIPSRQQIGSVKYCEIINFQDLLDKKFVISGQTFINNGSLLIEVDGEKK